MLSELLSRPGFKNIFKCGTRMRNAAAAKHGENMAKTAWQIHVTNWGSRMAKLSSVQMVFLSQKSAFF